MNRTFDWPLCHEAERFLSGRVEEFLARNSFARGLSGQMTATTGTLLADWIDHLVLPASDEKALREAGFEPDPLGDAPAQERAFWHPRALLPRFLLRPGLLPQTVSVVAIRVDSVQDFLAAHGIASDVVGAPLTRFRRALVAEERGASLHVVERRGYRGYSPKDPGPGTTDRLLQAHELWRLRPRMFASDATGWTESLRRLDTLVGLVGPDLACHVVFWEERAYWQRRNHAARVQKERQDGLGLGWANHDHHTFRCSRTHFVDLMRALERLGFERRERYHAGAQAGWGAQILEQPVEGIVAFCDVDLSPEETDIDFSRKALPPVTTLGTVGLWVALHGESFLEAGLHHLECRFDHERLRDQLSALGVKTMNPFSTLPFLKQAFTEGERWPVRIERAERLRTAGLIDATQYQAFVTEGAIGSHLENLQRRGGFKGFNQKGVSAIIAATDPRGRATGPRTAS